MGVGSGVGETFSSLSEFVSKRSNVLDVDGENYTFKAGDHTIGEKDQVNISGNEKLSIPEGANVTLSGNLTSTGTVENFTRIEVAGTLTIEEGSTLEIDSLSGEGAVGISVSSPNSLYNNGDIYIRTITNKAIGILVKDDGNYVQNGFVQVGTIIDGRFVKMTGGKFTQKGFILIDKVSGGEEEGTEGVAFEIFNATYQMGTGGYVETSVKVVEKGGDIIRVGEWGEKITGAKSTFIQESNSFFYVNKLDGTATVNGISDIIRVTQYSKYIQKGWMLSGFISNQTGMIRVITSDHPTEEDSPHNFKNLKEEDKPTFIQEASGLIEISGERGSAFNNGDESIYERFTNYSIVKKGYGIWIAGGIFIQKGSYSVKGVIKDARDAIVVSSGKYTLESTGSIYFAKLEGTGRGGIRLKPNKDFDNVESEFIQKAGSNIYIGEIEGENDGIKITTKCEFIQGGNITIGTVSGSPTAIGALITTDGKWKIESGGQFEIGQINGGEGIKDNSYGISNFGNVTIDEGGEIIIRRGNNNNTTGFYSKGNGAVLNNGTVNILPDLTMRYKTNINKPASPPDDIFTGEGQYL